MPSEALKKTLESQKVNSKHYLTFAWQLIPVR